MQKVFINSHGKDFSKVTLIAVCEKSRCCPPTEINTYSVNF